MHWFIVWEQEPSKCMSLSFKKKEDEKNARCSNRGKERNHKTLRMEKYPQKVANTSRCKKCNKYHKFDNYPAKGKNWRNCDKINLFAICCWSRTRKIREIKKQLLIWALTKWAWLRHKFEQRSPSKLNQFALAYWMKHGVRVFCFRTVQVWVVC